MSVFNAYECQVLRTLLSPQFSDSEIDTLIDQTRLVSWEHTGVGYFVTVSHPCIPSVRQVCYRPQVEGRFRDVHCGFVLFFEDGKLTLECFSFPSHVNPSGDLPGDIRELPLAITQAEITDSAGTPSGWPHYEPTLEWCSAQYLVWLNRVIGWDAALPLFVSTTSYFIARTLKNQPPADILALVGVPVVAFSFRFAVGTCQIKGNTCGTAFRRAQLVALVIALFILTFVDFFIALVAFVPKGNGPDAGEMWPLYAVTLGTYVTLVAFAMYPGRCLTLGEVRSFSQEPSR